MTSRIAVGITTRNRPASLAACVASLDALDGLLSEVLVFDDGSEPPATVGPATVPVSIVRDISSPGYIAGRNRIVRAASAAYVLLLDDDTRILSRASVASAVDVLDRDPAVGAVAFAQAEGDGRPWPASMQASTASAPALVPSFIGFAHLLRRDLFLALGGYRERFVAYGEEKDYAVRLLEAGSRIVYLPEALVAHLSDPASRDARKYLRFVARNDCLMSLYNDPLPRLLWMLPYRYAAYFRMRRGWKIADPGGGRWLAAEIATNLGAVLKERSPVSRRTLALRAALRRHPEPYSPCS